MSRPVRIEYPGAIYHVSSHGTEGQSVFPDDEDRGVFFNILDTVVSRFSWLVHCYVLMDDHYHLIVEVPDANLSRGMRQLNGVFTQHFNRKHRSEGQLFKGRFKGVLFEKPEYLLELCRHVVLNPVRAGIVASADKYRWSSHRAAAGFVKGPGFLYSDDILSWFGARVRDNQRKYRRFIREGRNLESPLQFKSNQVLLGSPAFLKEMQPILNGEKLAKRGPRRAGRRRSLTVLFRKVEDKPKSERNELIRRAHIEDSYTLMEIGDYLGIHYTTVSKVINQP